MAQRSARAATARETLMILDRGYYTNPAGRQVMLDAELSAARSGSRLYPPEQLDQLVREAMARLGTRGGQWTTAFTVVNETTLHAARRLLAAGGCTRVLALNFASAKNPGGGFLNGSQAQEESLARASGLYPCIAQFQTMYDANRRFHSCLYTDHLSYSPDVPVFRDDDDTLLEAPFLVSFISAPAVNAGVVRGREGEHRDRIEAVMLGRMEKVLAVAAHHGHDVLVLGAWGCGVFANDPEEVARWFAQHLTGSGAFAAAFRSVTFAVLDKTNDERIIGPFARTFGDRAPP